MPITLKDRPAAASAPSPARQKLLDAHATLQEALEELEKAQEAERAASRAYWAAYSVADDIKSRMDDISARWSSTPGRMREDLQRSFTEAEGALKDAKRPLYQLGIEREAAEKHLKDAENILHWKRSRVAEAAEAVVTAEVGPTADRLIEQLKEPMEAIMRFGPALFWLEGRLTPEQKARLGDDGQSILTKATGIKRFEMAWRTCPLEGAKTLLINDANAKIPSVIE